MTVPNYHAKLASLLGISARATESQVLETLRNLKAQRDTFRELAQKEPWGLRSTRWEVIGEGEMIAKDGKAWHVTKRQVQEGRRVKVWLRATGEKAWDRIYRFDDVADVLMPSAELVVQRLLRAELDARLMSPEEAAEKGAA